MSDHLEHLNTTYVNARLEREKEENFLNLWSYIRRRYPEAKLENKNFYELIHIKNTLENFHELRQSEGEIATVRKY